VSDFNDDGILDLACGNYYDSNVAILLGNGDGTFQPPIMFPAGSGARGLVAADFNGDGRIDLGVANQFIDSISIFLQPLSDTTPPTITLTVHPKTLWPPNGRMVPVMVSGKITDSGSGVNLGTAVYFVRDEYGKIQPGGPVTLGPAGRYAFTVLLQASRRGSDLDGRQYKITVRAADNAGNLASKTKDVVVPHSLENQFEREKRE
jgi:VCBS repeat protein